jgi:hypothetical protein
MTAFLTGMRQNLNVVLLCISFMAEDVEHFMYLLMICKFAFEKYLFNQFPHLPIGLFILLVFNFSSSLYILDMSPLSDEQLAKIFPHSLGYIFTLLIFYFAVQKLINLTQSHCQFLLLFPKLLEFYSEIHY